jgi:hypothetical protein
MSDLNRECPRYPNSGPCKCAERFDVSNSQAAPMFGIQPLIADRLMRGDGAQRDEPRYFPAVDTPGVLPLRYARPT